MADLGVFLEKDFDPKAYINAACANKPADQALDRCDSVAITIRSQPASLSPHSPPLLSPGTCPSWR